MTLAVRDVVRLKLGGPDMTVERIDPEFGIRCKWFAGKTLHTGNFKVDMLRRSAGPVTGVNVILERPPEQ